MVYAADSLAVETPGGCVIKLSHFAGLTAA